MLQKITFLTLAALLFAVSPVFAQGKATVTGRVISSDSGKPPEDVVIDACDPGRFNFTGAAGRFSIAAEVGDTIRFSSFGYKTATHTVSKAGDHDIGDFVLEAKHPAPGTATVTGRLISTDGGKPLAGVTGYDLNRETAFSTDAAGRFAIEAEAGKAIRFYTFGHMEESHTVSKTGKHDIGDIVLKKDFAAYDDTTVVYITRHIPREGALITGRVVDADTGKPLPDADVIIDETENFTFPDAAGHFKITAKIGDTIYFLCSGYESATHIISKAGNYDTGDIVLRKTGEDGYKIQNIETIVEEYNAGKAVE